MKFERLQSDVLRKPWRSCVIVFDSGERIRVSHPEMIYFLKPGKEVIVYENGTSWRFEASVVSAVQRGRRA